MNDVVSLFDRNARTYDRVNSVVSLGLDRRWRRWVAEQAVHRPGARVLDAFSGTGRTGIAAAERGAAVTLADVSSGMLAVARAEAARQGVSLCAVECDLTVACTLPGAPFDAVTLVWGLRYLADPAAALRLLAGTLAPGGRIVLLEFVEPRPGLVSSAAGFYFFRILPKLASALAGDRALYEELVSTTHRIGDAGHVVSIVTDAGLTVLEQRLMGFGLVLGLVAQGPTR